MKQIKKSVSVGTTKININTENQIVFTNAVRQIVNADPKAYEFGFSGKV